ncbi:MAG: N-acetylmuramoyl-L-alanine amidase [Cyclobacteriaceae bacterium]|nr:N-acetylmuramoyl-L-alanine amidase [Cyclobacteriaceae bacterium]
MTLTIDNDHLLQGENVVHLIATKNTVEFKQGNLDTLIIHYTAGRDAESSARYLRKEEIKASAHLVIGRNGEIFQLVPFNKIAWHAGRSSFGGKSGYNNYSIGIELDNAGVLTKTGNDFQSWFGKKYTQSDVMEGVHRNESQPRYWHIYTERQLEVNEEITRLILDKYKPIVHILGHEEISPGRKQDPGPAFPLDKFRRQIIGDNRDDQESSTQSLPSSGLVIPGKLNIRSGAGSSYVKVANPLVSGQKVKILEEENGWYRVKTEIEGWVSKGLINAK